MKLKTSALGLAAGIFWGFTVFLATLWVVWARGGGEHLLLLSQFYLGYRVSVAGAFIGLVYGFVDGFVCGWIFAWLYNRFAGG